MTTEMRTNHRGHPLTIGLAGLTPIAFVAAIPWLKDQPDGLVYIVTAIAAMTVLGASLRLGIVRERGADEYERMGARFASHWGMVAGGSSVALLIALPPVQELLVALAGAFAPEAVIDRPLVLLMFTAGFVACVLAQMIFNLLLGALWRLWTLRAI